MMVKKIRRFCGHLENIGIMGADNSTENAILGLRAPAIARSIARQESKYCLPCFEKLPTEDKQRLLKAALCG